MPWNAKNSVFERLDRIAEVRNLTREERLQYDASLKHYRDTMNVMRGEREEGIKEGMEKGIKEGLEKGIKEGMEKGLEKGKYEERLKIANSLKGKGLSLDMIQYATGLSPEEIEAL